jgi:hypothetical protein
MKHIILTTIFWIFGNLIIAQNLPKYLIVSGDTIGMTLSIGQVKRIKRDLELKSVLETMRISCDSVMNKAKNQEKVFDEKLKAKDELIRGLDTSVKSKTNIIKNLNGELKETRIDRDFCKKASATKDSLNTTINLRLAEVGTQRNFWFGGTVVFFITTLSLLLFH